ncbi:DUF4355 domain-containing protein [Paratractidigestivibacter sp.]|uniref:DUF4355 domain-containing protein n=1 Tax=Paratractidigestivibacter sp. TaxID=2847316 RepID=UPI002AC98F19|nr:DUF4355 domain-containing protein [Paratractidigestivibacter sp.]
MAKDGNRQKFAGIAGGEQTPPQGGNADPAGDGAEGGEGADPEPSGNDGGNADPKPSGKTYTDDEVNAIVQQKLARESKKLEKRIREELAQQADDKRSEAEKLTGMNDLQRAQYELKKAQGEKAELERRINLSEQMGVARSELKAAGIDLGDELLSMFVTEKADDTNAAISKIKELFPKAVNAAVQEALKRQPPKDGAGSKPQQSYAAKFASDYSNRMNGGKKDGAQ